MINISDKANCCGCEACSNICPVHCITMKADEEGFLYPNVDNEKCINCGRCENICPILNNFPIVDRLRAGYAAINTDLYNRLKSSSGGVFTLLAEHILNEGGVVVGCSFSEDCKKAYHLVIEDKYSLEKLRGSKYLQSNIQGAYINVKKQLENNRKVLFSGTPCQVAALKSFLKKEYNNLICIDLICHGVPSPLLWNDNVEYIEKTQKCKLIDVNFRGKKHGGDIAYGITHQKGIKSFYRSKKQDPYFQFFLQNLSLRPSCYKCLFKGLDRISDITLGDFWGIEDYVPELEDGKGVSVVVVHSVAGEILLEKLKSRLIMKEINAKEVFKKRNKAMCESSKIPENRNAFWNDYQALSFDRLCKKHAPVSAKERIKIALDKIGIQSKTQRLGSKDYVLLYYYVPTKARTARYE